MKTLEQMVEEIEGAALLCTKEHLVKGVKQFTTLELKSSPSKILALIASWKKQREALEAIHKTTAHPNWCVLESPQRCAHLAKEALKEDK